jgi:hypothetical protein
MIENVAMTIRFCDLSRSDAGVKTKMRRTENVFLYATAEIGCLAFCFRMAFFDRQLTVAGLGYIAGWSIVRRIVCVAAA